MLGVMFWLFYGWGLMLDFVGWFLVYGIIEFFVILLVGVVGFYVGCLMVFFGECLVLEVVCEVGCCVV